ncbi:MAG: hypothetical protein A2942_01225 [Candidatus Lloydbacteria bacterium RIFCSPLOWO2_01_FULL_50_20]|uniref:Uncharacterized protein n=1 Tax=Candidatus Lloydbacteria bacterium RIFCSPLOWO2_01_FULL_50_20 TaxID=1798665 RepID=A0A1G2DIL7_9BACT|nr:MAG: hypothetical protein A3C13_00770 [Candidatus Lloydbacteria bacterium RIFCSPHIGHO2_02_FULL_50_11]OGZ13449.1 MAG: hypothetical protein A2942_01225 [Candidatus Lloydbacteria bacterium RIFCSPLOWO2_01_FULL_50_20]
MSLGVETQKLECCSHCLIGSVILKTKTRNVSPMIGGEPVWKVPQTCYCDNCGTLFHVPTMLKKLSEKKDIADKKE